MKAAEKREAMKAAGFRERYAMENGKEEKRTENGETLYIFTYAPEIEYQDANGATYNATRGSWTN